MKRAAVVFVMQLAAIAGAGPAASLATPALPPVMLWAWERPEDLRFAAGRSVGVAYLAATLRVSARGVEPYGRRQPLALPPGAALLPVVRVEARGPLPAQPAALRRELAAAIAAYARAAPGSRGVQIDFDAPASLRPFYRALLADVRHALPDSAFLSMTALASWCLGDRWLDAAPVDEVVPMLFRMGPDAARARERLARTGAFDCRACAGAIGLSTDEPGGPGAGAVRVYLFHPGPWTRAALDAALARLPAGFDRVAAR